MSPSGGSHDVPVVAAVLKHGDGERAGIGTGSICDPCRTKAKPRSIFLRRGTNLVDLDKEAFVPGKFVLKKGLTGKFHFNLHASNGQVIATSEAYNSREAALNGIESVKKNALDATIEDEAKD